MKEKRAMKCPGPGWKKRRDPNYPPANLTAYMHYAKETRDAVVAALPAGSKLGTVSKKLGENWKNVGAEEKARYQAKADADAVRFKAAVALYVPPAGG